MKHDNMQYTVRLGVDYWFERLHLLVYFFSKIDDNITVSSIITQQPTFFITVFDVMKYYLSMASCIIAKKPCKNGDNGLEILMVTSWWTISVALTMDGVEFRRLKCVIANNQPQFLFNHIIINGTAKYQVGCRFFGRDMTLRSSAIVGFYSEKMRKKWADTNDGILDATIVSFKK